MSLFVLMLHIYSLISSFLCNKLCPSSDLTEPACLLRHIVTSMPPTPLGWGLFQVGKTHSRRALLSRLPKYPPSMLYPKAQFPLPLISSAGLMIYAPLVIYASWLSQRGRGHVSIHSALCYRSIKMLPCYRLAP